MRARSRVRGSRVLRARAGARPRWPRARRAAGRGGADIILGPVSGHSSWPIRRRPGPFPVRQAPGRRYRGLGAGRYRSPRRRPRRRPPWRAVPVSRCAWRSRPGPAIRGFVPMGDEVWCWERQPRGPADPQDCGQQRRSGVPGRDRDDSLTRSQPERARRLHRDDSDPGRGVAQARPGSPPSRFSYRIGGVYRGPGRQGRSPRPAPPATALAPDG